MVTEPDLAPRHVSMALTNKCNMSCENCYIRQNDRELTLNQAKNYIDQLDLHGCLSIGFGGGEPTIWKDLINLLDYIKATQMGVTLTTNGTASVELYIEILKRVNLLRFSVDGIGSIYEQYRKQSFDELINKIKLLSGIKASIGLNYLLTDSTVKQLSEFATLIKEIKPKEILLIPCLDKNGLRMLTDESETAIRNWVNDYKEKVPLAFSYSSIDMVGNEALPIQSFDSIKQHYYFLHINANGDIMKSVFDKKPIKIGESLVNTLKELRR